MSRRLTIRATVAAAGAVLALAGLTGSASAATGPPTAFETTPPSLNFGTALVGTQIVKPVKLVNRTKSTLYYEGAEWPNFQNPAGWEFPDGFWNMSYDPYPCYEIAPKSACTLMFGFQPQTAGAFASYFSPTYGDGSDSYSDTTYMRGAGIAPPS